MGWAQLPRLKWQRMLIIDHRLHFAAFQYLISNAVTLAEDIQSKTTTDLLTISTPGISKSYTSQLIQLTVQNANKPIEHQTPQLHHPPYQISSNTSP